MQDGTVYGHSSVIHKVPLRGRCVLGVVLGLLLLVTPCPDGPLADQSGSQSANRNIEGDSPPTYQPVDLYFGHSNGRHLAVERRRLAAHADPAQWAHNIVEAWLKGPRRKQLVPIAPTETQILGVYVTGSGTAYVDFDPAVGELHPGGCQTELLTIYGLVNSLVLNIPQVTAVKILIAGAEATTLAGHILLQEPFQANLLLVR